jgi:hypothetical protein
MLSHCFQQRFTLIKILQLLPISHEHLRSTITQPPATDHYKQKFSQLSVANLCTPSTISSSTILVPQSSENKTKSQQASHHLPDLQITANKLRDFRF